MEINITHLIERCNKDSGDSRKRGASMAYYSASQAELGSDAGTITWQNSLDNVDGDCEDCDGPLLTTEDEIQEAKDWIKEFGAWDDEEIEGWSDQEVNALVLQFIAGDIREAMPELLDDYEEYQRQAESGSIGGRIYKCDVADHDEFGQWFFYLGS